MRARRFDSGVLGEQLERGGVRLLLAGRLRGRTRWKRYWDHPNVLLGCALLQVALGFASSSLATLVGAVLTTYIVVRVRPSYLPALLVSQITAKNFFILGQEGSATAPNPVPSVLALAIFVRVTWEVLRRPRTFGSVSVLLVAWYLAVVVAIVMTITNRINLVPSWTLPVRVVWGCGAFFYGLILARRWNPADRVFTGTLFYVMLGIFTCLLLGVVDLKYRFVLPPLAVPVAWLVWKQGRLHQKACALVLLNLAALAGLGWGVGGAGDPEVVDSYGIGGSTLTQNGLFLLAVALTVLLVFGPMWLRRIAAFAFGWPAFGTVVALSITVALIGPDRTLGGNSEADLLTLREKTQVKLFNDRSMIWDATLRNALEPPYFFAGSEEPIVIDYDGGYSKEWNYGGHNSVINTLSRQRWLNGVILLTLLGYAMHRGAKFLAIGGFGEIHAVAVFVLCTATVGVFVNDYPMNEEASAWFFGFAGLVSGVLGSLRAAGRASDVRGSLPQALREQGGMSDAPGEAIRASKLKEGMMR